MPLVYNHERPHEALVFAPSAEYAYKTECTFYSLTQLLGSSKRGSVKLIAKQQSNKFVSARRIIKHIESSIYDFIKTYIASK